jgi:nucleotide-binding universal stress UspA family protein
MFRKILVPLDGSEISEKALEYLDYLATSEKETSIVLLHIVEPILPPGRPDYILAQKTQEEESQREKNARNYLKDVASNLSSRETIGKIQIILDVSLGGPSKEILDYADAKNVDLILMTTHGRSGVSRWALGSVTDRVVSHSKVPVLAIPPTGFKQS